MSDLDPLILLVDILAVYRLTRLIVKDSILNEVRWWILRRWPSALTEYPEAIVIKDQVGGGVLDTGTEVFRSTRTDDEGDPIWLPLKTYKWTELLECVFCASIWIAFGVLAMRVWWDWWQYPALALALAGAVALIFSRLDTD